jgi:hypothetical protein
VDRGITVELRASFLNRDRRRGVESRTVALAPRDGPFWIEPMADRQILADALDFVLGAAGAAFADRYRALCVGDASRFAPEPLASVQSVMAAVVRLDPTDPSTYPIVVWMVREGDDLAGPSVRLYEVDRNDDAVFFATIRRGAIWISISDVHLDVIHRTEERETVLRWFESASRATTIPVMVQD